MQSFFIPVISFINIAAGKLFQFFLLINRNLFKPDLLNQLLIEIQGIQFFFTLSQALSNLLLSLLNFSVEFFPICFRYGKLLLEKLILINLVSPARVFVIPERPKRDKKCYR